MPGTPQMVAGEYCRAREDLIKEIEQLKAEKIERETEWKMVVCGKEEAEIERDTFKTKFGKLSEFLASAATCSERITLEKDIGKLVADRRTKRINEPPNFSAMILSFLEKS